MGGSRENKEEATVSIQIRGKLRWFSWVVGAVKMDIVTLMCILELEQQGLADELDLGYEGKGKIKDKI